VGQRLKSVNWSIVGPVALVVAALLAVAWFDVTKGGAAKPQTPLGEIGTPIRNAYVAPSPTPIGLQPTPRPKPTFAAVQGKGTPEERDGTRRTDLLLLLGAANDLKAKEGAYPSTSGNVQTLCAYKDLDQGCKLKDFLANKTIPFDPLGDPVKNGYWYSSDGKTVKVYASLETEIADAEQCTTSDAELQKKAYVICIGAP
jgi:hypothetical protein